MKFIKNWLERRKWKQRREHFLYFSPDAAIPDFAIFAAVKEGLSETKTKYIEDVIDRNVGICHNAGFLYGYGRARSLAFGLFLKLASDFNREVRGINVSPWEFGNAWPFADIDGTGAYEVDKWVGEGLRVRMDCIDWIIKQIDTYKLDQPK